MLTFSLKSEMKLFDEFRESLLVLRGSEAAVHLPALGILPVQVQTIKVVLFKEADHLADESLPAGLAVHKSTVLISLGIIPTSDSQQDFLLLTFKGSHFLVEVYNKIFNIWKLRSYYDLPLSKSAHES